MVEGPAAAALGQLARERWRRAGLYAPEPEPSEPSGALWPAHVAVDFREVEIGIARTEPKWRDFEEVRETERLHLAAIAAARRLIYLENQYIASPVIAEALAARLAEPDGPEIVILSTARAPSWFDHMTMDRTRSTFLRRLIAADTHGRFHAYCPYTRRGLNNIIVHSKVSIIDDQMLRAGSTNLNNRSCGFDTECDVAMEAESEAASAAILRFRARLLAHYLGCAPEQFQDAFAASGSLAAAIETLDTTTPRRLRPLAPVGMGPLATVIAAFHLGDPAGTEDSWRPWRRKANLERARQAFMTDLVQARAGQPMVRNVGTPAPEPADG